MSLIKEKMTFGRDENFSLRYGWLAKGFGASSHRSIASIQVTKVSSLAYRWFCRLVR